MKLQGRAGLLFLFVVVGTLMLVNLSQAAVSSHKINAKGVGLFSGGTTETQIIGGGLLQGTASGISWVTGGEFPVFEIAGTETFTTNKGTLTVEISGTFDFSTGEFVLFGPVIDADGKLEGATGTLMFEGVQDITGVFTEDITGVIFVDLSP
jgi:hypothetical protein